MDWASYTSLIICAAVRASSNLGSHAHWQLGAAAIGSDPDSRPLLSQQHARFLVRSHPCFIPYCEMHQFLHCRLLV